jgi:hypothetical protein
MQSGIAGSDSGTKDTKDTKSTKCERTWHEGLGLAGAQRPLVCLVTFVRFVLRVSSPAWVPAFAGMSGTEGEPSMGR